MALGWLLLGLPRLGLTALTESPRDQTQLGNQLSVKG